MASSASMQVPLQLVSPTWHVSVHDPLLQTLPAGQTTPQEQATVDSVTQADRTRQASRTGIHIFFIGGIVLWNQVVMEVAKNNSKVVILSDRRERRISACGQSARFFVAPLKWRFDDEASGASEALSAAASASASGPPKARAKADAEPEAG